MAEQLDQPTLNWLNTFIPAARAMIAGDTDQAELLAARHSTWAPMAANPTP